MRLDIKKWAFKKIVDSGAALGLLAYDQGKPVGWCAIEPRTSKMPDAFAWTGTAAEIGRAHV